MKFKVGISDIIYGFCSDLSMKRLDFLSKAVARMKKLQVGSKLARAKYGLRALCVSVQYFDAVPVHQPSEHSQLRYRDQGLTSTNKFGQISRGLALSRRDTAVSAAGSQSHRAINSL